MTFRPDPGAPCPLPFFHMASVVFYLEDGSPIITSLDDAEVVTIGRHPDSNVHLDRPSVSAHHATFKRRADGFYVSDVGSSNGTRVNGAEIEEALLKDGDRVAFGDVQAVFYAGEPPPVNELTSPAVVIPPPDAPKVVEAKPVSGAPPVKRRFRSSRFVRHRPAPGSYPEQTGSGCLMAMFLTGLFIVAFFAGLALKHYQQTDRSLMSDLMERITQSMPKVKIERE